MYTRDFSNLSFAERTNIARSYNLVCAIISLATSSEAQLDDTIADLEFYSRQAEQDGMDDLIPAFTKAKELILLLKEQHD